MNISYCLSVISVFLDIGLVNMSKCHLLYKYNDYIQSIQISREQIQMSLSDRTYS